MRRRWFELTSSSLGSYDDLSRLTTITTPDNTITLTYDAASNPLTVGDSDSSVTFT